MEENYYALAVSIMRKCTPEQAFNLVATGKKGKPSKEDTLSMVAEIKRLRARGKTYREIGKLYDTTEGNIYRKLKAYENAVTSAIS